MRNESKRGFSFNRTSWGYTIEWYDGRGTYVEADGFSWLSLPWRFLLLWWEVRRVG